MFESKCGIKNYNKLVVGRIRFISVDTSMTSAFVVDIDFR